MAPSAPATLSADQPLSAPDQDRLGYAGFAQHVANAIALAPADGAVFGLHGRAGSGRTTVANFVRTHLSAVPSTIVLEFNPWLEGAEGTLDDAFARRLGSALAGGVSDAGGGDPVPAGGLSRALREARTRYVVVVDDIDRLGPGGMERVSRLVRAVAALPNVVYLLVFDRGRADAELVARTVAVPMDVPLPEAGALGQLFLDNLRDLLERHPPPPVVTQHHFDQAFTPGIETLLGTPRDVVRLTNALLISYPPLAEEVNTADFIGVEALRVFQPALYDLIRRTPERFSGTTRPRTAAAVDEDTRRFHEAWRSALEPQVRAGLTTLVMRLFPSVPDFEGLVIQRDAPNDMARQELRVASPELFSTYFRFQLPASIISHHEMDALLAQSQGVTAFAELLVRLGGERTGAGGARVEAFLDRLADLAPEIGEEQVATAVGGVLEAGDALGGELDGRLQRLLSALLARVPADQRAAFLKSEMASRAGLGLIVAEVARLGREHGRDGAAPLAAAGEPTVDAEGLAGLEEVALSRVREAAGSGRLLDTPRLPVLLERWRAWDRNACVRWVADMASTDEGLIKLVTGYLQTVRGPALGGRSAAASHRLDPETMRPVLAPEYVIERVRRLSRERAASGQAQTALDQFVVEYELRHEGQEPADRTRGDTDGEE